MLGPAIDQPVGDPFLVASHDKGRMDDFIADNLDVLECMVCDCQIGLNHVTRQRFPYTIETEDIEFFPFWMVTEDDAVCGECYQEGVDRQLAFEKNFSA